MNTASNLVGNAHPTITVVSSNWGLHRRVGIAHLWAEIIRDIPKRPFITVGFTAFLLLIPLAATSTNKMMRRLKKNWIKLHKLVYVIAVLGVLHFLWVVKADTLEPMVYASILLVLLGYRAYYERTV